MLDKKLDAEMLVVPAKGEGADMQMVMVETEGRCNSFFRVVLVRLCQSSGGHGEQEDSVHLQNAALLF